MFVREIMRDKAEVIRFDRSVQEAAQMMRKGNFGSLPIEQNDRMVGMITDRDITIRVVAEGLDPKETKVIDCMTEGISYCYDDEDADAVARKMASVQVRRLPVINRNKRLVGIVSLTDMARNARNEKLTQEIVSQVAH